MKINVISDISTEWIICAFNIFQKKKKCDNHKIKIFCFCFHCAVIEKYKYKHFVSKVFPFRFICVIGKLNFFFFCLTLLQVTVI